MQLSYWEKNTWLSNIDYAIIGSGIVGLNCALHLRKHNPKAKIVVFERGILPSGASTKNAGFSCFGSISEILSDLKTHTKEEVTKLISQRIEGLQLLRNQLGDEHIDYQEHGGYELFETSQNTLFNSCVAAIDTVNKMLLPLFNEPVFSIKKTPYQFKNVLPHCIYNKFEGQIDTGKMMQQLLQTCINNNILILNATKVIKLQTAHNKATFYINDHIKVSATKVCIATNGFAQQFLEEDISPARAQVLVTKPIDGLQVKGTFHLEEGYYYFRNIHNRILLGGGRNLDFKAENTTVNGLTEVVQNKLLSLLENTILPTTPFKIDTQWSGIMGVGSQKKPIVKQISPHIYCGVRLGGMGVAIGSIIGKKLATLAAQ